MAVADKTAGSTQTGVLDHLVADRKELLELCQSMRPEEWETGEGETVCGPAEAIIMTLADRPAARTRLSGQGVVKLAALCGKQL